MRGWEVSISVDDLILVGFQVVTVGIVGGSDLVKITEQLGKTGTYFFFLLDFRDTLASCLFTISKFQFTIN